MFKALLLLLLLGPLAGAQKPYDGYLLRPISEDQFVNKANSKANSSLEKIKSLQNVKKVSLSLMNMSADKLEKVGQVFLPLEEELVAFVVVKKRWRDQKGKLHVFGKLVDDYQGRAHLVVSDMGVSGNVLAGGRHYSFHSMGDELHVSFVYKESREQTDQHSEDLKQRSPGAAKYEAFSAKNLHPSDFEKSFEPNATSDNFIDVMFIYTDDVIARYPDYESSLDSYVDYTNQALEDSCANYRLRNVHMTSLTYTETGDANVDLDCVTDDTGECAGTHALRNTYGADLVQFVTDTSNYCGLAWIGNASYPSSLGYSTLLAHCGASTMAHEFGHNKGLHHDRYQVGVGPREEATYETGYGFVDLANKTKTIMSYSDHCVDNGFFCNTVAYYSNPSRRDEGVSQGIQGFTNATRRLNANYDKVANFRPAASAYSVATESQCLSASEEDKDIHCFIATAAYGSYLHKNVIHLRNFRDRYLKTNSLGRKFVDLYYDHSPKMAFYISDKPWLKKIVRFAIAPFVFAAAYPMVFFGLIGLVLIVFMSFRSSSVRKLFLVFGVLALGFDGEAMVTQPSLFKDRVSTNPAAVINPAGKTYLGYTHDMYSGESSSATTSFEEDGSLGRISAGFNWANGGAQLQAQTSGTIDQETKENLLPPAEDQVDSSSTKLNVGLGIFESTYGGFHYSKIEEEIARGTSAPLPEERSRVGLGGVMKFTPTFALGGGVNLVTEEGEELPEAKWLEAYLGFGFGVQTLGTAWLLELAVIRSPEVVETDGTFASYRGETLTTQLRAETEATFFELPWVFGLGYGSTTESKIENINLSDLSSSSLELSFGFRLLQNSLHINANYLAVSKDFNSDKSETTIGIGLIYNFSGELSAGT